MKDGCTGKKKHHSEDAAFSALRKVGNRGLSVDSCPQCANWHLGSSNRDWKKQARIDQLLGKRP